MIVRIHNIFCNFIVSLMIQILDPSWETPPQILVLFMTMVFEVLVFK